MGYEKNNKLHIVSVVAVIRNPQGKYLVLKRSPHEVAYPGKYTFPGGKTEGNDSIEETLFREAAEEAGLELLPGKVLLKDKSFTRPDGQTVKVFSYLCEAKDCSKVMLSKDFTDFKWVTVEELRKLPHVGIEEELLQADKLISMGVSLEKLKTKSVRE